MDEIIEKVARDMERDYASQSMHGCGAIGRIAIGHYKKALEDAGYVIVQKAAIGEEKYRVITHDDGKHGVLPDLYDTPEAAEVAGRMWRRAWDVKHEDDQPDGSWHSAWYEVQVARPRQPST